MHARTPPARISRRGLVVPQIYADLRSRILSVALEPGAAVSESRIARDYGVSRTPVREAFKKLAEDGLLDVVPQVGTFVARVDVAAVRDSQFIRETLECRIAELAARRAGPGDRTELDRNLARQADAVARGDAQAFFDADEAMHQLLAAIAGHPSAWQVIHAAKSQLDRVRRMSLADPKRLRARLREHRTIVERIARGDAAGAVDAMREHVRTVFESIRHIAAGNAGYFAGLDAPGQEFVR